MLYKRSEWSPSVLWIPQNLKVNRQSDGSVIAPDGTVVPPFAACPPDTQFDRAAGKCAPAPGARNIMYECGGLLAPWGSTPDCIDDFAPAGVAPVLSSQPQAAPLQTPSTPLISPVSFAGGPDYLAPRWTDCACKGSDQAAGSQSKPHRSDGACCDSCAGDHSPMPTVSRWCLGLLAGLVIGSMLRGGRR